MQIKRRTMCRGNWRRLVEREDAAGRFDGEEISGAAGLIHMVRVEAPWSTSVLNRQLTLIDDGYWWLQIAPEGCNWWLTVMLDADEEIIQYYFDITRQNVVLQGGDSYFDDLFLDVVFVPGTGKILLDGDELDQALKEGVIDAELHGLAHRTAGTILEGIGENEERLAAFCMEQFQRLKAEL